MINEFLYFLFGGLISVIEIQMNIPQEKLPIFFFIGTMLCFFIYKAGEEK